MGNVNSATFDNVVAKIKKDVGKYDNKLEGIIREQKKFVVGVEDFFEVIIDMIKVMVGMLDMALDTTELSLIIVPAFMIIFVSAKLTTIL
jgi:hypothetical protein